VRIRSVLITIFVAALATSAISACTSSGASDDLVAIGAGLKGPTGVSATVYARGLSHVSALTFDGDGRLWAATASYEDTGKDGVYVVTKEGATPTKVLAGLHTPLGLLWHDGALYVASRGRVDVYREFDGAEFAQHEKIVTLPSGVGDSNQIVVAPDGRLLMGVSASCDHCVPTSKWSGSIVSFEPDGSDLRVFATGIRAPVGLAYYPGTSDLFVTMNQRDDLGDATPGDWLSLVHDGDDWGFPSCYGQSSTACATVPTATAVLDKHAAVSGVAFVSGAALVAEWADGKVQRVTLTKTGTGYTATVHRFLTGLKNPVPVISGSGGAVFVGDWSTGIVYEISRS
jgi:glucose/arabinose dehydrogenase